MTDSQRSVARVSRAELLAYSRAVAGLGLRPIQSRASAEGGYRSAFKGRGMEFAEARPYEPGDDIRRIDWRVTARSGRPHTKVFREERERPVLLWVDYRASMFFATRGVFKAVQAARAAALLAWIAHHNGDRVGGFIVAENNHWEARPGAGLPSILRFLGEVAGHAVWQDGALQKPQPETLNRAVSGLRRVTKPGSLVFLVSDFRGFDATSEGHLGRMADHSRLVCLAIADPWESDLPTRGRYLLTDGRNKLELATGNSTPLQEYRERFRSRQEQLELFCRRHRIALWRCWTNDDITAVVRNGLRAGRF